MSTSASPSSFASLGNNGPQDTTAEWEKLFQAPVEEDDPIWKVYIAEAAAFDNRMIDQWNKVIDVVLVYVALFLSVLAAFVVGTSEQLQRDPADISNQLLLAIYQNQLAYLQNTSADTINITALFQPDPTDRHNAVVYNSLLYADLAVSIVVSMIALFAKLWVISYDHEVNSSGSPYERAMKRQEAYSGVIAWRMKQIINSLPFLLLIAVFMLGVFIYQSIRSKQITIGYVVGAMLLLGLVFLILASAAAAFIPACPFHSSLTTLIKLFFKFFPGYYIPRRLIDNKFKPHSMRLALVRIMGTVTVSGAVIAVMITCVLKTNSGAFYALICIPFAAGVSLFGNRPRLDQRPLKFGIQYWVFLASIFIAPFMIAPSYYSDTRPKTFLSLFLVGCGLIAVFALSGIYLFKFTPETRETDAITWLLERTASQEPSHFQKAGQISKQPTHKYEDQERADSKYDHRQASMLTSLQPLLFSLITSKVQYWIPWEKGTKDRALPEKDTKDLAIYVACLSQLSAFDDSKGEIWKNKSAIVHPTLSPSNTRSLVDALEKISDLEGESNSLLRSAAQDALKHYKTEGKESV